MGSYRRGVPFDGTQVNTLEIISTLKKQLKKTIEVLDKAELSISRAQPEEEMRSQVFREKSTYGGDAYMPDYVLDEKGYIVDVLPGSVRITLRDDFSENDDGKGPAPAGL